MATVAQLKSGEEARRKVTEVTFRYNQVVEIRLAIYGSPVALQGSLDRFTYKAAPLLDIQEILTFLRELQITWEEASHCTQVMGLGLVEP
jgi:hypothetical protein